jgi:cysteinyl-tRNA synthetase
MSMKYLGETFDIHAGGVDLIFPHHENEIAQSESATGKTFVRTWLHSEHLLVDGQKMSKSLGNQYTWKDLEARGASARALRYLFLSVHYRQKLNFTFAALEGAAGALRRIDEMRFRLRHAVERAELPALADPSPPPAAAAIAALRRDFTAGLADDLNVSAALAALFAFVKAINVAIEGERLVAGDKAAIDAALAEVDQVLGVLDAAAWPAAGTSAPSMEAASATADVAPIPTTGDAAGDDAEIERLVGEREDARRRRDFAAADRLRAELAARGIVVEDTPQGARWKRR